MMNKATITLQITVSSDTILPTELHHALSNLGGELTAQVYDQLRDNLPDLVKSDDYETDWSMNIEADEAARLNQVELPCLN
jgi:hypothetical protein